ncbi:MAG: SIS domain-containing protein [Victivallaceae bacterium]
MENYIKDFLKRFPELEEIVPSVRRAAEIIIEAFADDKILYLCGNGGSASDCEHIAGELLKSFKCRRQLLPGLKAEFEKFTECGKDLANKLEYGLRAVTLTSHPSFSTAFANDVDASMVFAQQLFVLSRKGDVLIGISTSGNAQNVKKCFLTAKVKGVTTILLTGKDGGICAGLADCVIRIPEKETFLIQEKHVGVYHLLCLVIEDYFYGEK